MNAHVALERLKVAEVSAADLAGVRLLSCVDQHMGAEMGHLEGERHKNLSMYTTKTMCLDVYLYSFSLR